METMNEEKIAILRERLISSAMKMKKAHKNIMSGKISPIEMFTLEMLERNRKTYPEGKGIKVSDIAKKLRISIPQMSRMLNTMEKKEYIIRVIDIEDRRNVYVSITGKGIEKRDSMQTELIEHLDKIIIRMGSERIEQLSEIITEISEIVEDEYEKGKETK